MMTNRIWGRCFETLVSLAPQHEELIYTLILRRRVAPSRRIGNKSGLS